MTAPSFDPDGFVDMSQFDATDPDVAVGADVLGALRNALVTGSVPELSDDRWAEALDRAVGSDDLAWAGDPAFDAGTLDVDALVPPVHEDEAGAAEDIDASEPSPAPDWLGLDDGWRDGHHPLGDEWHEHPSDDDPDDLT
jgi:hypothetical protein